MTEPILATVESTLDARLEYFLRDRLSRTFTQAAQPIVADPSHPTPTPNLVEAALRAKAIDIIAPFHPLPTLLMEAQAHNSPRGLLAVIRGSCGPTPVLVLVKVEQERGMSFETTTDDGGQVRVEVVIEDGLVFTDKTEVFKAALFYLEDGSLAGVITDDQTGSMYRGPSSLYWIRDFLGCQYARDADVQTRSWVKATERLIKSDVTDPAEKDVVLTGMLAELGSNRANIDPRTFIADFVPVAHQDAALQRLRDEGAPVTRFPKSRDVSSKAPARKKLVFDTGYEVTMPADAVPELSRDRTVDGGEVDVLTIRGHIRRIGA